MITADEFDASFGSGEDMGDLLDLDEIYHDDARDLLKAIEEDDGERYTMAEVMEMVAKGSQE